MTYVPNEVSSYKKPRSVYFSVLTKHQLMLALSYDSCIIFQKLGKDLQKNAYQSSQENTARAALIKFQDYRSETPYLPGHIIGLILQ